MAYLNDILAFLETHMEYFYHLRQVLGRIRRHWIEVEMTKMSVSERGKKYLSLAINEDRTKRKD